jgi:hypothetical protein
LDEKISHQVMKIHALSNLGNSAASQTVHKEIQNRSSGAKHETHRYERRKVREYLRHNGESEEASLRLERFG